MKILQALQKKQTETSTAGRPADSLAHSGTAMRRADNIPPSIFANPDLKIGAPSPVTGNNPNSHFTEPVPNTVTLTEMEGLRHPEFASFEINPESVNPRLVAITQPNSAYCEEYRSLRTHILHKSQKQKLQSIVVASAGPSEGKSVTALNLAWLLAQTDGIKALIIDSDLRLPSLTEYLGIEAGVGLSHVLEGQTSLQDAIIRLDPGGLHLLPGGSTRSNVAEMLSGPKFKAILRDAREMFDYVIIDAPPLGIFTDAAVLINHADGALLVVRANQTRYKEIDRILENLPRERMLGAVLNQSEDVMNESYYNHIYYANA
ncbi:MAG: CpsD/CapB family tyrosine-protein kinase [Saprospiraceae bacterium]|nr:CpsD/CapB family tyrosine-protein kinase [Pyrinomonadaceae bacterium]